MPLLEYQKTPIEDIERKLLSSLTKFEHWNYLRRANVTHKDFEIHQEIAKFILEYPKKFSTVPTEKIVKTQFPNFEYSKIDDTKYILDLFRKEVLARRIRSVLYTTGKTHLKLDADEAAKFLLKNAKNLVFNASVNRSITDGDTTLRYDVYLSRKEEAEKLGFSSEVSNPWNDAMYFWLPGMLGIIWGMWSAGKSFLAMDLAVRIAYLKNKKTVFVSPEMTRAEAESRFDSILGRYKGYNFSSSSLIMGKNIYEEKYLHFLEIIKY